MYCRTLVLFLFFSLQAMFPPGSLGQVPEATTASAAVPTIQLQDAPWGSGESFPLDGLWHVHWGELLSPEDLPPSTSIPVEFPVPSQWPHPKLGTQVLPALGYLTYHVHVQVPDDLGTLYLYLPDMPSAYRLFVNGRMLASNGTVGRTPETEQPGFVPKVVPINDHQGQLELVLQMSNFHYREGAIWFSLRLTDASGRFAMEQQPLILAVFFGAILLAIGLYNISLFVFRRKEVAALYFGLLCLVVGLRRLLIDERVIYLFDWFSWATLQRVEHLCFYLAMPLFMGFFVSLYHDHVSPVAKRICWLAIVPFVAICLAFPARIYTEFNVAFQLLVVLSILYICLMYLKVVRSGGKNVKPFGLSLLVLAICVVHDVLKANGFLHSPNIAHFGVLAFVVTQSIALQRSYLGSLILVQKMSKELQIQNKELREMDAFKDEFLATTSHELRTPLHGIAGLAKVLKESDQGNFSTDQRSKIELIANTTERLRVLVNDILDFSSIKHGKLKLNLSCIDLNTLAELVLATLKPLLGAKRIELSASIDPQVRYLNADEHRMQQILFNLLGNAVKYTEQGYIRLTAKRVNGEVVLQITDSGVGIPEQKRASLFRPFEQVHVQGHYSASGSGLGLSISQQLVRLHGGELTIDSVEGQGTTVRISFPSTLIMNPELRPQAASVIHYDKYPKPDDKQPKTAPHVTEATQVDLLGDAKPLIFVVDDEQVNRELVASQLTNTGYRVEMFEQGLQVLERMTQQVPDLILLDFIMPKMNGLEVCQAIRKQHDSYEVPIMMLTARHQISDIVGALGAGANDYLTKPYQSQELLARVNSQLSVRKYWIANRENQKLRHEISRREALEVELSELNTRLLNVLDVTAELILLVNDSLHVVYANEQAIKTLASDTQGILGQSIGTLVNADLARHLQRLSKESNGAMETLDTPGAAPGERWQISVKRCQGNASAYMAVVVTPYAEASQVKVDPASALAGLTQELTASRKKIDQIEDALRQVMSKTNAVEPDGLEELVDTVASEPVLTGTEHKEVIATLHRTSLNLWECHTSKGKADLAERSRCWRVYLDGTTVKTRTFDKYLSARTVPDRPRWRAVVRTANYVVANCPLQDTERSELKRLMAAVEAMYS